VLTDSQEDFLCCDAGIGLDVKVGKGEGPICSQQLGMSNFLRVMLGVTTWGHENQ